MTGLVLQPVQELLAEHLLVERLVFQLEEAIEVVDDDQAGVVEAIPDLLEEGELVALVGDADEQEVHLVAALLRFGQNLLGARLVVVVAVGDKQHDRALLGAGRSCRLGFLAEAEKAPGFRCRAADPAEVLEILLDDVAVVGAAVVARHLVDDLATDVVVYVIGGDNADMVGMRFTAAEREHVQLLVGIEDHAPGHEALQEAIGQAVAVFVVKRAGDVQVKRQIHLGNDDAAFLQVEAQAFCCFVEVQFQ